MPTALVDDRNSQRRSQARPGLVVVKGSGGGGLGDRLRAVLVAMLYCRLSGRRLWVDWRDGVYAERGVNAFPALFDADAALWQSAPDLTGCSVHPHAWRGRLGETMHDVFVADGHRDWDRGAAIATYSFDLARLDHAEDVLVMWDFDQLPRLQAQLPAHERHLPAETLLRRIMAQGLAPRAHVVAEAQRHLPAGATIGVHVRATREAVAQKGDVALSAYYTAIDDLRQRIGPARIVLATDNSDVEAAFRRRFGEVATRPKWLPQPGAPVHLNPDCPDLARAAQDALIEIVMLSRCDGLVTLANSSFSLVARLLSQASAERQIVVRAVPSLARRLMGRLARAARAS